MPGTNREAVLYVEGRELHKLLSYRFFAYSSSNVVPFRYLRTATDEIERVHTAERLSKRGRISEVSNDDLDLIAEDMTGFRLIAGEDARTEATVQ